MTECNENGLSQKQAQALPILAASRNISQTCQELGIATKTYYEWRAQPIFRLELEKTQRELVTDAMAELKALASKATTTLSSLMDRLDCPAVQRAAANDVLNHLAKYTELEELGTRIQRLEQLSQNE